MSTLDANARREQNYALYNRMAAAQNAKDAQGFLACLARDIVFEAPAYSKTGEPIAKGRDAMAVMFKGLSDRFDTLNYQVKRFIPAVDPDLVLVEVRGDNKVSGSDKRYRNNYIFLVTCRDGEIAHIFEYSNPQVYDDAVEGA
jgi:ketosteroid isomerase-like protein